MQHHSVWLVLCFISGCAIPASTSGARAEDTGASLVAEGAALFHRVWAPNDPRSIDGDGLGPMYNADSCVACHVGGGGAAGIDRNVTLIDGGVLHRYSLDQQYETFRVEQLERAKPVMVNPGCMVLIQPGELTRSDRNTPALWGVGLLESIPVEAIEANVSTDSEGISGRMSVDADGEPGRLGWKGDIGRVDAFVREACSNELGLTVPDATQAEPPGLDMSASELRALTRYVQTLPAPQRDGEHLIGRAAFEQLGCAGCHMERLGPVSGLYSDLLLHDMGDELDGAGGSYGARREDVMVLGEGTGPAGSREWRTPPLWGVADTAPYLHDGRAATLVDAIQHHGGEAYAARMAWHNATPEVQGAVLVFLNGLRAPVAAPPDPS
ncbi:MAG: di-heme oxidoredictase family protein [Myxococcota bacterium]